MSEITFDQAKQVGIVIDNTNKFLAQVNVKRKDDLEYYNECKQTLSRICGYDSSCVGPVNLYDDSIKKLLKLLEI